MDSDLRIGTSGFSFKDWRGTVYPDGIRPSDMLSYYARVYEFTAVEINSTYYRIPDPKSIELMAKKVPENFEFTIKAHRTITHDPFDSRLDTPPSREDVERAFSDFREAIKPLSQAGKLGAVLLQFPFFFPSSSKNRDYILFSRERLGDVPIVVEFRNRTWLKPETFEFLKKNEIGFCCVDEPALPGLMPFVNEVTSKIAYFRLHGRNPEWFNSPVDVRYNYLYSDDELREFVPEIKKMCDVSFKTYVFFNNCHRGSALKNALRMRELMGGRV